jgi:hypothetical protein
LCELDFYDACKKNLSRFNPATGEIDGVPLVKRRLSDLRGCFADAGCPVPVIANPSDSLFFAPDFFRHALAASFDCRLPVHHRQQRVVIVG